MYGKIYKNIYHAIEKSERELLTFLIIHADKDGLVDVADVMIQHRLHMENNDFQKAKAYLLGSQILYRICSVKKIERVPMWTTGRFILSWNNKRPNISEWGKLRQFVFERDDYTCRYCGARGGVLECDHIVPVSKGGSSDIDNLATACKPCNRSKSATTLESWLQ